MALAGAVASASCTFGQPDRGPVATVERAVLPMADAALDAGQVETAKRLYTRLLEVDEGSVAARTGLGRVAMAERDPGAAASWHLAAAVHATLSEERHAALLAHGRAALAAGQQEAAMRSFARLASPEENASDAHAAWAHNGVGMVRWLDGDPRGAVAAIEKAVLRNPDEPAFGSNLAVAVEMLSSMTLAPAPAARDAEETGDRAAPPDSGETAAMSPADARPHGPEAAPAAAAQPNGDDEPAEADAAEAQELAGISAADVSADAGAPDGAAADGPSGTPEPARDARHGMPLEADGDGEPAPGGVARTAAAEPQPSTEGDASGRVVAQTAGSAAREPEDVPGEPASLPGLGEFAERSALAGDGVPASATSTVGRPPDEPAAASDLGAFVLAGAGGADYVQAGAYASRAAADALAARLRDLTAITVSVDEAADGGDSHRVRIGPLDVDEVPALAAALEESGFGGIRTRSGDRAQGAGAVPETEVRLAPDRDVVSTSAAAAVDGAHDPGPVSDLEAFVLAGEDGADYVQAGAYASRAAADALAARLRDLTAITVSVDEAADGGDSHRVRIGPLDVDEVPALAAVLEESGFGGIRMRAGHGDAARDADGAAPSLVVVGDGGSYLQVGAYGDRAAAEALAARLRTQTGEPVTVSAWTKDDGTPVHRVRIGPLDDARSAALADLVGAPAPR